MRKQVLIIVSVALASFLMGATFSVVASDGENPFAKIWKAISNLQERVENLERAIGGKVGLILATGGLGDKSFNDISYAGVQRAKDELGIDFDCVQPTSVEQYEVYQRAFAATGDYRIIICVGFDQADALATAAAEYPLQKFAIIDNVVDMPNVASLLFKQNEGSFLVGVIAGLRTTTGKVGFVGGMDIPLIQDFFLGYEAGAEWASSGVEVVPPVFVGSWADPTAGKELALGLADLGVDVIYAAAGKSGLGVLEAVHERGILGLGVDACQCYLYSEVIASMTKRVDVGIFDMIEAAIEETFEGGIKNGGLKEGWVGCCRLPEEESFWEDMFGFTHAFLDPSVIDLMEDARNKIIAGEITVPSAFD
jgi:basic membrane protein A